MTDFKRWDQYVAESGKPDFELPVDDDKTIRIRMLTGEQTVQMQRLIASGADAEAQLRLICGDAADEVLPLVMSAPAGAMEALVTDIGRHFGFDQVGESAASSN